ncbi:hypothetical protein BH23PAT2_BH23PAT2_09940 [soil metagenome]
MDDFTNLISVSANEFWKAIGGFLPSLFGAILLIIIGAFVAKIVEKLIAKLFALLNVNEFKKNKTVKKTLDSTDLNFDVAGIAGRVGFWIVIIIFALAAAEVLGLDAMRDTIRDLLGYVPNVLAGIIVLTITIAGARLVRDAITAALTRMSVDFARPVANVSYYVLVIFGTLMALDQLGFDTTILTNNITVIVAGFTLALALAFGLGGRDVAGRIVEQMYNNATTTTKSKK